MHIDESSDTQLLATSPKAKQRRNSDAAAPTYLPAFLCSRAKAAAARGKILKKEPQLSAETVQYLDRLKKTRQLQQLKGRRLRVYWPEDDKMYAGTLTKIGNGWYQVTYDDGRALLSFPHTVRVCLTLSHAERQAHAGKLKAIEGAPSVLRSCCPRAYSHVGLSSLHVTPIKP